MKKQDLNRWQTYFEARNAGVAIEAAARKARLSPSTAYRFERGDPSSGGLEAASILGVSMVAGNLVAQPLSAEASRALEDFAYFRRRYFGRNSTPWQERAAYDLLRAVQTKQREYIVMNEPPGSGKALALDTPLPTPTGWTTMGEVRVGDTVIGGDGRPVMVIGKTEVMHGRPCFRVTTDDRHSVIADAEHLWPATIGNKPPKADYAGKSGPKPTAHLYTTEQLAKQRSKRPHLRTVAIDLSEAKRLPIHPWILGAWLGDGSSDSGRIASHQDDQPYMRGMFHSLGYATTDLSKRDSFGVPGLQQQLRKLGVLRNRHIPQQYLRASRQQRMDLLRGLTDTDGYVDASGRTEITSTKPDLAAGIVELVASLGVKVTCTESRAMLNGRDVGPKWRISFALDGSAGMPRKSHGRTTGRPRYLTVEPVESVPVACIQVANADGLYLAGKGMLLTHNSTLFTHDIPTWLIVRDRTIRIQIGSRTERQARMYVGRIKRSLERDAPLRASAEDFELGHAFDADACLQDDFGAFKPEGRTDLWRAEALVVRQLDGVQLDDKEPTVSAWGQDSGFLGGRFDFVVWDDLVDRKNTKTAEARDASREWWDTEAETRLEPHGTLLLQGQRIAHDDLYRYCVSHDSLIRTIRGDVQISKVVVGDVVLTRNGWRSVEWSGCTGIRNTVTLATASGMSLTITPDHRIATPNGWVEAGSLAAGDALLVIGGDASSTLSSIERSASSVPTLSAQSSHNDPTTTPQQEIVSSVRMPLRAVRSLGIPFSRGTSSKILPMVLVNKMRRIDAARIVAEMRSLMLKWLSVLVEVPDNHARHELFPRKHPVGSSGVSLSIDGFSIPDQAFTFPFASFDEPSQSEWLPFGDAVTGPATGTIASDRNPTVDTVVSITHSGMVEVWDLTVNDTHEFYANGILVHNCLDKKTIDEQPKYRHIVFKAHDESVCTQDHNTVEAWPKSCLLDPYRLPWAHLETLKHNNPRTFDVMYQQADGDVVGGLIDPAWIEGGVDADGIPRPGCLDRQRIFLDPPESLRDGNGWSFITVDPSPTEWWGIIWWLYDPNTGNRYIIDLHRVRLNPEQFLSLDLSTFEWSGLIPDLYRKANDLGIPISHVVVEVNAAQRWLLSQPHVQRWITETGMVFVPHTTSINKQDPKYGLESIGDLFRQGMIRIPWGDFSSRTRCQHLIEEGTKYPDYETTDLIMSVWFSKLAVENHYAPRRGPSYHLDRPAWLGHRSRGLRI